MTGTRTNNAARCPACLKTLNGAFDPSGNAVPEPGDISVCAYCSTPLIFHDDLTLRALRTDEYAALEPELRHQLDTLRKVAAARRRAFAQAHEGNDMKSTSKFITGQAVRLVVAGQTVDAVVELASPNSVSLMLKFDAGVWVGDGMYGGQMPVLRGDDGVYRDLINDRPVKLEPRP